MGWFRFAAGADSSGSWPVARDGAPPAPPVGQSATQSPDDILNPLLLLHHAIEVPLLLAALLLMGPSANAGPLHLPCHDGADCGIGQPFVLAGELSAVGASLRTAAPIPRSHRAVEQRRHD